MIQPSFELATAPIAVGGAGWHAGCRIACSIVIMTDSSEDPNDDTARDRMEVMLAAMRRPGARRVDAAGPDDEERLAAIVRRAVQRSTPSVAEIHELEGVDTRLGRYLPIEELGRGAMGRVLRAYDPKLEREVALKVLKAGSVGSLAWARMAREARTMARLNHPNVVAVYDVVDDPGHGHVIAMELVKGTTLQKWLEQRPRAWGEVLEAFIEAGHGLAAAHAQGLLHRDFKPANALVALGEREGTRGPVKVTDFGLARRNCEEPTTARLTISLAEGPSPTGTGETLTEAGAVVGTPVYMAPEQHRGDTLTSAADQYAFCVALWEAVYGERPIGGRSLESLTANVLEGRRRPTPKGRAIPSRLRRACERGLSLDPRERWPSMEALLTELRKLVAPRARRWMALGLAGGLTALGGGLGLAQYAEVMNRCTGARAELEGTWDERRKQEVEAAILGAELIYAPGTWERVEQRLDDYANAWADEHTEACEATSVRHEQSTEVMDLRMSCLRQRRTALRAAVDVLARADEEVVENAVELVAGLPLLTRCDDVDLLERQHQRLHPSEDPRVAQEVEVLRERLAGIIAEQEAGKYARALQHVEPVVQRAEALGYPPLLAEAKLRCGRLLVDDGRYAEAERQLEVAYALAVEHGHDEVAIDSARVLTFVVGDRQARHAEALVWGQTALPLAKHSGDDIDLAGSLNDLGNVFLSQGEYEQAGLHHQQALQLREKALSADHPDVIGSLNNLGGVFYRQGKYEQAKLHYQRALQLREQALGAEHPDMAGSSSNLGNVFFSQGEYEQAELHYQRALQIWEKALGTDHPDVATGSNNLGNVFFIRGEYEQAELHHRRALQIREKAMGPNHPQVATSSINLGRVLLDQGDYEQAKPQFQRALQILEKTLGPDHPNVAKSLGNLGLVFHHQGEHEQAKRHFQRALQILEEALGPDHPDVATSLTALGNASFSQGEYAQAELHHRRALQIREKALGPDHPDLAFSLAELARTALAQQRFDSARAHAERVVAIREAAEVPPDLLADARFLVARALWPDRSQRARARALAEQARDTFAEQGKGSKDELAETEQWLAEHRVR